MTEHGRPVPEFLAAESELIDQQNPTPYLQSTRFDYTPSGNSQGRVELMVTAGRVFMAAEAHSTVDGEVNVEALTQACQQIADYERGHGGWETTVGAFSFYDHVADVLATTYAERYLSDLLRRAHLAYLAANAPEAMRASYHARLKFISQRDQLVQKYQPSKTELYRQGRGRGLDHLISDSAVETPDSPRATKSRLS